LSKLDVESVKKREAYIDAEFYRVAKNALTASQFSETRSYVEEVLPQVPVADKKANIVVLGKEYERTRVLLVVECKQRPLTAFGKSYANACKQAWRYSKSLDSAFFAIYDGWLIFVFRRISTYLVGVYNAELERELTDKFVSSLFIGLMEYAYRNRSQRLDSLPAPRDPELLKKRILPLVARSVARQGLYDAGPGEPDEKAVENSARQVLEVWLKNLSLRESTEGPPRVFI